MQKTSSSYPDAQRHHERIEQLHRRSDKISQRLKKIDSKIQSLMTQRLVLGLLAFFSALILLLGPEYQMWGWVFLVSLGVFIQRMRVHGRWRRFRRRLETLKLFFERQAQRLKGRLDQFDITPLSSMGAESETEAFLDEDLHLLSRKSSLFQLMNETLTEGGEARLKSWLLKPLTSLGDIKARRAMIESLSQHPGPLIKLCVIGQSQPLRVASTELKSFVGRSLLGPQFKKYALLHMILFPAYLLTLVLQVQGVVGGPLALPIALYALFSLFSLAQVSDSFSKAEDLNQSLEGLKPLLVHVESKPFAFQVACPRLFKNEVSKNLGRLGFYISGLSVQGHFLVHFALNALSPWTYSFAYLAERWRLAHASKLLDTQEDLFELEALLSLALVHHFQSQTWPEWKEQPYLKVSDLYHPLIDRSQVKANSLEMSSESRLALITGSNMSGKSTFLRTVGLNQHLALIGAPVFAREFVSFVAPVMSCLHVSDSLEAGYSSFYAEVRRVKQIIERARNKDSFIYLIDEIFRGTNNRERLKGSQAVVEHLLEHPQILGLISTHDLELTQLGERFQALKNFHFRDEVVEDQLHFSYLIQPGPCPTTNALRIMALEGLPVGHELGGS